MWKKVLVMGVLVGVVAMVSAPIWSQDKAATSQPAGKSFTFDSNDALEGSRIVGDVAIDMSKPREGKGGSLKVLPEAKATFKLDPKDGCGKVEMYVFDDGTKPEDPKAGRAGPRWGIVQSDGSAIACGVLYAAYLAGDEGYTVSSTDGQSWFEKLTWLGVNRAGRLAQVDVPPRRREGLYDPVRRQADGRRPALGEQGKHQHQGLQRHHHLGRQQRRQGRDDLGGRHHLHPRAGGRHLQARRDEAREMSSAQKHLR